MKNKLDRELETETYEYISRQVLDVSGKAIRSGDICRVLGTNDLVHIETGFNHSNKITGLVVINETVGIHDWLDVYPDGELEIIAKGRTQNESKRAR